MKRVAILLLVVVILLDFALADTNDGAEERPGRRNRNRNRNQQGGKNRGRKQKNRGCKYERPQAKLKEQCQAPEPITVNLPLNTTARNGDTCAATKELTFNCSKLCKYEGAGTRSPCNTETRTKTITMTLKSDMPAWCPPTFVKTRACGGRRRGGSGGRPRGRGNQGV